MLAKFLAVVFLAALAVAEIPPFVTVCGRKNPNVDECIQNSMTELRDKLKVGIPELKLPSFDPFHIDKVDVAHAQAVRAVARDVSMRGVGDFVNKGLHADFDKKQFRSLTFYKKIIIESDYDVDCNIVVPIVGRGPIHIEADDVAVDVTMKYELVRKNGVDWMHFTSVTASLNLKYWTAVFSESETMDNDLATTINTAIEGGREPIFNSLKPNIERVIAEQILDRANKFSRVFSFDELFPDRE